MYALGIDTYGKTIEFALIVGVGYLAANTVQSILQLTQI
jgi:hypothetical protein